MLPMPARNFWSISSVLSFMCFEATRRPKLSHDIASSSGSMPRCASSDTSFSTVSSSVTNISPNVRGSMKRSWPPCVNVITTCVCFETVSRVPLARMSCPDIPRWITSTSPPSSVARMYLPRRSTPVIRFPTSLFANCLRLWCLRIDRIPSASTDLTRLPTISRSRSRRTTSTSGNSGIVCLRWGPIGPRRDRAPLLARRRDLTLAEIAPRHPGGRLLRVLLRSTLARPPRLAPQHHGREEPLRVVGSLVAHLVAGQLVERLGRQLLEARLVVVATRAGCALDDAGLEQPQHELARRVPPAVEVDGRDHGLHGVGEDRRLVAAARRGLALAEQQRRAQVRLARHLGDHLTVDDRGAQLRQLALGHIRVLGEHVVGDDEAEDGIAEELEPLVRQRVGVLRAVGAVGERAVDQRRVAELEPEHALDVAGPRSEEHTSELQSREK